MKTWFTADTHFGCTNLIEQTRPCFSSAAQHDTILLGLINRLVGKGDRLYIVGDFCDRPENMVKYRRRINCKDIWLILGNHDKRKMAETVFGVDRVRDSITIKAGPPEDRKLIYLAHFPHAYWDKSHYGSYHAYGHTHGQREAPLDAAFPTRRSRDVGMDAIFNELGYYEPITQEYFLHTLRNRTGHDHITEKWAKRDYTNQEDE